MRPHRSTALLFTTLLMVPACGGGGGGPSNPAETPTASTSTVMDGIWVCTESSLVEATTVYTHEFVPGEAIEVWQGQLIGRPDVPESWLRADIEYEFGHALGWYTNEVTNQTVRFHAGYDRLGAATPPRDYYNYGLQLAATGADELTGFEAAESQETAEQERAGWSATVRFVRVSSSPSQLVDMPSMAATDAMSRTTASNDSTASVHDGR